MIHYKSHLIHCKLLYKVVNVSVNIFPLLHISAEFGIFLLDHFRFFYQVIEENRAAQTM